MDQPTTRPALKLRLPSQAGGPPPVPDSSAVETPMTSGGTKIKIKFKKTSSQSPSVGPDSASIITVLTTPSKRKPAKKAKADTNGVTPTSSSKKRPKVDDDDLDELAEEAGGQPKVKKIKLKQRTNTDGTKPKTILLTKLKGKAPERPLGVGYDSEASDREDDPAIEEEIVFRMQPGDDCEYLRDAIQNRKFGLKKDGGVDVHMKFLQRDGRRGLITIRGNIYAVSVVDLPCIIEGMKSWDKKGWWKGADICQMLLVLGAVKTEEEAKTYPLPKEVDPTTWQYAHGLTAPMHWVRRRRFRKRISKRTIEAVEDEVNRLLEADDDCFEYVKHEIVDPSRATRDVTGQTEDSGVGNDLLGHAGLEEEEYDEDEDAEGELDDSQMNGYAAVDMNGEGHEPDELEMEMNRAFLEDIESGAISSADINSGGGQSSAVDTPAENAEESGDESSDDEDAEDEEVDEDALQRQQDLQQAREEIADLQTAIKNQSAELERQTNPILKQKVMKKIQSLKADLHLKKDAIGEGDE